MSTTRYGTGAARRRGDGGQPDDRATTAVGDAWTPPSWDEVVRTPLGARLPAGLPPDRQPARRRGPHAGGLRPRLPLAVQLHARHVRGLAAPHHDQPVPRPGAPQGAHPLRRAARRRRAPAEPRPRSGAGLRRHALRPRRAGRARRAAAGLPRRRRAVRPRGPVLRGDRRDPRRQDRHDPQPHPPRPLRSCAPPWPTAPRPRSRHEPPARSARERPASATSLAALVDGELDHAARERAQRHLAHCAACRAEVDDQRRLKARLRGVGAAGPRPADDARRAAAAAGPPAASPPPAARAPAAPGTRRLRRPRRCRPPHPPHARPPVRRPAAPSLGGAVLVVGRRRRRSRSARRRARRRDRRSTRPPTPSSPSFVSTGSRPLTGPVRTASVGAR